MAKNNFTKKLNGLNYEPIVHVLGIIIVILFIINLFFITSLTSSLKLKIIEANEASRPANLELTVLTTSLCADKCFDIQKVVDAVKSGNVNITKEENLDVSNAQELIQKYNIKKLPSLIVKGELNKTNLNNTLTTVGDSLVFMNQTAPYYDIQTNRVKGLVVATIINADNCQNCTDLNLLLNQLKLGGIVVEKVNNLTESQGKDLIQAYNILKLPTFVLSSDAIEYPIVQQNWISIGSEEVDGNLVLREIVPPYKNLITSKIDGLVSLIYVNDSSCKDCYDVKLHKQILDSYGLVIVSEKTLDVATPDGYVFVKENNITLVPTIVLSKDARLYTAFYKVFGQVSKEVNNNLIFTSLDLIGKYKNLETGEVVEPTQQ